MNMNSASLLPLPLEVYLQEFLHVFHAPFLWPHTRQLSWLRLAIIGQATWVPHELPDACV